MCGGRRFGEKVLSVRWNGKNISDILSLSVEEAMEMFAAERRLAARLHTLCGAGLGYLELGQTLTTLSGGEGQRLKLAKELMEQAQNNVLYLMDEPTVGLHPLDVEHFLALLNGMVEGGATVIAVEHNQQVIAASDWVVELGPGGGVDGGRAVFSGDASGAGCLYGVCNRTFFGRLVALNKLKRTLRRALPGRSFCVSSNVYMGVLKIAAFVQSVVSRY